MKLPVGRSGRRRGSPFDCFACAAHKQNLVSERPDPWTLPRGMQYWGRIMQRKESKGLTGALPESRCMAFFDSPTAKGHEVES